MFIGIKGKTVVLRSRSGKHVTPLKVVGYMRDGRRIAVNEQQRFRETSMAVYPGYLVPRYLESVGKAEEVVVKLSSEMAGDAILVSERDILLGLPSLKGIPEVIGQGEVMVEEMGYDEKTEKFGKWGRKAPFFVMPRIKGKDLDAFTIKWGRRPPSRKKVALLATEVFPALANILGELHASNVVHRDVKPNNILYDRQSRQLTLLDFGRANWLDAQPRSDHGTYTFFPPEFMLEKPDKEDVRYDVYSLGVTCFVTLTGRDTVLFGDMFDPTQMRGVDFMFHPREMVAEDYCRALYAQRNLRLGELAARSNLPPALKETSLGRYLVNLFHPAYYRRPRNLFKVAQNLRMLGGRLLEHEIWT